MQKVYLPQLDNTTATFKWNELIVAIFHNCFPGVMIFVLGFYVTLHVVQNLFAELLRFGDRLFYEDWWITTGYLDFFRSWNILVGDWLYTYIYKDVYELIVPNKLVAKYLVFLISAIVHEWILYSIFRFLFPVLFMQMTFSASLAILKSPQNRWINILLW